MRIGGVEVGLGEFLRAALTMRAGAIIQQRRAEARLAAGEVECTVRVVSGELPGLDDRWRDGVAVVTEGRVEFRDWKRREEPVAFQVRGAEPAVGLEKQRRRDPGLQPYAQGLLLTTPAARVELVVLAREVDWVTDRLAGR